MLAKVALFEMLRDRGIRYVFGNPGTTELNFMEMFADYPDVAYILGLQDAIPVGMAYGYAQATGAPAFVNLHITPGVANGLGNIFNAYKAKTPLVVMKSGRVKCGDLGGRATFLARLGDHFIFALVQALHAHVTDIGDVLDRDDGVAEVLERSADPIREEIGAQIPEVHRAVHRGTARIHAHLAGPLGGDRDDAPLEGVVDVELQGPPLPSG